MQDEELTRAARILVGEFPLAEPSFTAGSVGAALRTEAGTIYTGVCLDLPCGIGFCAEHSAVAAMLAARETRIVRIVAVNAWGVIPPCGRCRELLVQVNHGNLACEVMLADGGMVILGELLPHVWNDKG